MSYAYWVVMYRAAQSVTPQSETELVDKSSRSMAVTAAPSAGTAAHLTAKTGKEAKSYVALPVVLYL